MILTVSITVKMLIYGPLIGKKHIREVEKKRRKFPQKVMVWLGIRSESVPPLVLFGKGTLNHHRYIKEVLLVTLRYGNSKFGNNWTSNKTTEQHILTKKRKNGVLNIFNHLLTRIHDQRIGPV